VQKAIALSTTTCRPFLLLFLVNNALILKKSKVAIYNQANS